MGWAAGIVAILALTFFGQRVSGQRRPRPMAFWLENIFLTNPLRMRWFSPYLAVRLLPAPQEGLFVGEVGTGVGVTGEALARATGREGRYYGIDIEPEAVVRTRARIARANLDWRHLSDGDARHLPWEDGLLDAVVMVAVLGEVPHADRLQVLLEVRRVLKPDGVLVVVEYWPDPHFIRREAMVALLAEAGFGVTDEKREALQYGLQARARG